MTDHNRALRLLADLEAETRTMKLRLPDGVPDATIADCLEQLFRVGKSMIKNHQWLEHISADSDS